MTGWPVEARANHLENSTLSNDTPQNEDHPSQGPRNPKAEIKAAKAYAKATRPWYKKKRVIIPAGLVVLTIAGSAGSSGDTGSATASGTAAAAASQKPGTSDKRAATPDKKAGNSEDEVAKVGQAVTNAGTTYKVTNVRATKQIGDPDLLGARADGKFVIVDLQLTNKKDKTKTFMESNVKLKASNGKEYETSDKAIMAFGDESLMLKDIQPDLTTRGKLAFEVPPSKVAARLS